MNNRYQNIINPVVADYLVEKYKPLNDKFDLFRKEAEENGVPIILPDTESLILNLIRLKSPENILEIGTAVGYSACTFAKVSNAHITTIELNDETALKAKENIIKFGFEDRIKVLTGDGEEITDALSGKYDFIFIDAAKSHYKRFFDAAVRHSEKGAVIICDNVLFKGRVVSDEYDPSRKYKTNVRKMREFIDYLLSLDYADTSLLSCGDGLTVTILKKEIE